MMYLNRTKLLGYKVKCMVVHLINGYEWDLRPGFLLISINSVQGVILQ